MNCSRCGRAIAGAFPGAKVTCECGAENEVTARSDPYRTMAEASVPAASHAPQKKLRMPHHPCPRCKKDMQRGGDGTFVCESCEGTFFTREALDGLVERARADRDDAVEPEVRAPDREPANVKYLRCPFCDETMNRAIFGRKSGIVIDVCAKHGTWFDHGEVTRAFEFARTHDLTNASASKPGPSDDEIARRAEVEALAMKESVMDATYDLQYRARVFGVEPTIVDQLASIISWLRGG